jgi:hypothetical protein
VELWWGELALAHKVFYAIAIATSAVLVLQLVLSFFGLDGDADADFDAGDAADAAHGGGVGILSVRTVTAFFTGFGWGGVAALEAGIALIPSVLLAVAAGGVLMAAVFLLMRGLYAMRYSGTLDYRNAIGAAGSAYIPIPAAMSGPGQVEVLIQGRLCVVRAFTRAAAKIPNRARVRVVDVLDQQTLLVEPLDPATPAPTATPQEG